MQCLLVLVLALNVASSGTESAPAQIRVLVPADARLYFNDVATSSTLAERLFDTPALEVGKEFAYTLRAEFVRGGRGITANREVIVRAGMTTEVDFRGVDPESSKKISGFKLAAEEQSILDLTNHRRAQAGLPPLRASEKLFEAARAHSANMARHERLQHVLDGKDPGNRLADVGYAHAGWAENCAMGQQSGAEAVATWMNSPGHRANLLGSEHTEIGIGIAASAGGMLCYTQVFARPAN